MFILRVIIKTKSGTVGNPDSGKTDYLETNQVLGDSYNLIHKDHTPEEFERVLSLPEYKDSGLEEHAYAFLTYNNGRDIRPIYRNQDNYIMTGEGKTFSHIKE